MLTCFMGVSGQMLLNDMIDEERSLKEKIENDIEIQKNQLNILRDQLGLDPYKVSAFQLLIVPKNRKLKCY